jgi:tRNA nucleotidyltransferase (CCA-adding enzyme)
MFHKAIDIVARLVSKGFESFFVGGAVRDMAMGISASDYDIVTKAKPEEVEDIFSDRVVKTFGKSFKVVEVDGIEVATYRKDKYGGFDDKDVVISYADTLEEDLERRDFTINAIAYDPLTQAIIDPHGGLTDIKERVIKFVGNPHERIFEDPNRIIRAARMKCLMEGSFSVETFFALRDKSHFVETYIDYERLRLEILKSMKYRKPSIFFVALEEIGALRYIFPSLQTCVGHKGGHHHAEDVFTHSMICGDALPRRFPLLRLSGYLHDVGKPAVAFVDEGDFNKLKFFGHHDKGKDLAQKELKYLTFSNDEIYYICRMIEIHMKNHNSPKQIRRILSICNRDKINYKDYIRIRIADRKANLKKGPQPIAIVRDILKDFNIEINRKPPNRYSELAIDGFDIMSLGFKPGPIIGTIQKFLFEKVMDDPDLNEREKLLELITTNF